MTTESARPEAPPPEPRSKLARYLLRTLMRLQAQTVPCLSWRPAEAQKTEAEAAARERVERG